MNIYLIFTTIPIGSLPDFHQETAQALAQKQTVFYIFLYQEKNWYRTDLKLFFHMMWQILQRKKFIPVSKIFPLFKIHRFTISNYDVLGWMLRFWRFTSGRKIIMISQTPENSYLASSIAQKKIYDCTDIYEPKMFARYKRVLQKLDAVFVYTPQMYRFFKHQARTVLISGGLHNLKSVHIEAHRFADSVLFAGAVGRRINFDLLLKVASLLPDIKFHFVGPDFLSHDQTPESKRDLRKWRHLLKLPNVYYLGCFPKEQVYQLMKFYRVGLIPYVSVDRNNEYSNRNNIPIKLPEYIAYGLNIICTNIPAITQYVDIFPIKATDNAVLFARHLRNSLERPKHINVPRATAFLYNTSIQKKVNDIERYTAL